MGSFGVKPVFQQARKRRYTLATRDHLCTSREYSQKLLDSFRSALVGPRVVIPGYHMVKRIEREGRILFAERAVPTH